MRNKVAGVNQPRSWNTLRLHDSTKHGTCWSLIIAFNNVARSSFTLNLCLEKTATSNKILLDFCWLWTLSVLMMVTWLKPAIVSIYKYSDYLKRTQIINEFQAFFFENMLTSYLLIVLKLYYVNCQLLSINYQRLTLLLCDWDNSSQ